MCNLPLLLQTDEGYGKSPEWVEVDGLIVSRSHVIAANNSQNNTLNSTATTISGGGGPVGPRGVGVPHQNHGSVLSLPYSSRTLLTYNGSSTSGTTQRSSARSSDNETSSLNRPKSLLRALAVDEDDHEEDIVEDEPPYETIPSVPPSVNITSNSLEFSDVITRMRDCEDVRITNHKQPRLQQHEAITHSQPPEKYRQRPPQPPPPPSEPEDVSLSPDLEPDSLIIPPQDDSVTSAHDWHAGIYDIISKVPQHHSLGGQKVDTDVLIGGRPQMASIDAVQGYFFRKKLLMQDANETRL